jgi:TRAP-type C4-dicarboxylate transport system permease small subunit
MERLVRWLSQLLMYFGMAIILIMALHVSASVAMRWTIGRDIPLTLEMTTYYYMVALTFLPLAIIDLTHRHIRAEFLYAVMPAAIRYVLAIAIRLAMVGYLGFLTWRTFLNADSRTRVTEQIVTMLGNMPIWPARWLVPFGLAVATLAAVVLAWRALQGRDDELPNELDHELSTSRSDD